MTELPTRPKLPPVKAVLRTPKPVRIDMLERAATIPGKAAQLLIGILIQALLTESPVVVLTRRAMHRVAVSRFGATDALKRLEAAGLVRVLRAQGCCSTVTLLEPGTDRALDLSVAPASRRLSLIADGRAQP